MRFSIIIIISTILALLLKLNVASTSGARITAIFASAIAMFKHVYTFTYTHQLYHSLYMHPFNYIHYVYTLDSTIAKLHT